MAVSTVVTRGYKYTPSLIITMGLGSATLAPTLTGLSPNSGSVGGSPIVTFFGTRFDMGSLSVAVSGTGVTAGTPYDVTPTSFKCALVIAGGASEDARDVT